MSDKESLRKQYRQIRAGIPRDTRIIAAKQAAAIFAAHPDIKKFRKIACYLPYKSEFDTLPIIEMIWQKQKECFLPVLHGGALKFLSYEAHDKLQENRYGINEPVDTHVIATELLDLVFLPLTAFDADGHRLGAGGGFYDKSFAFVNDAPERRPLLVGLGYAAQEAERLPAESWDIKLDAILTENEWRLFQPA